MSFLLDTNVISEIIRKEPNPQVLSWLHKIDNNEMYISVLTLGEIRKGVEKLENSSRKQKILFWLEYDLPKWFQDRVLLIDHIIADKWGFISAQTSSPLLIIDSLLAATALKHNLKLVTRNIKDFHFYGLEVINPWDY